MTNQYGNQLEGSASNLAVPGWRFDDADKQSSLDYLGVKQVAGDFDFVSFYSSFGGQRDRLYRPSDDTFVSLHSLRHKYLLICLVSYPLPPSVRCELDVIYKLYPELVSRAGGAFEMVFVTDIYNQVDFDNFFTPDFPGLIIPTSDSKFGNFIRDCIYLSLGLIRPKPDPLLELALDRTPLVGLILDPTGNVLQDNYCGRCFVEFGAEFFPFTYDRVSELLDTEEAIHARCSFPDGDNFIVEKSVSLADLLCCEPSRVLYSIGDDNHEITVRELSKKKCVGVYVCADGSFMSQLATLYNEFHKVRDDGSKDERDFEIVMVGLYRLYGYEALARIEPELKNASSWLEFPYNYETSLRLKKVCGYDRADSLIIVRPDGKFWERSGKAVLCSDGIASYPFTKESYLERMTSVTVDTFLGGNSQTLVKIRNTLKRYHHKKKKKYTVGRHLRGNNVFVYFDYPGLMSKFALKRLREAYYENKYTAGEFEVVFVPLGITSYDDQKLKYCTRNMSSSWFMLLPEFVNTLGGFYTNTESYQDDIVAFGKDGRIRSKYAQYYFSEPDGIATLFAQDLNQEESDFMLEKVDQHFHEIIDFYE